MKKTTLLSLMTLSFLCVSNYAYAEEEETELISVPLGIDYSLGSTDIRKPFTEPLKSLEFFFTLGDGYASSMKEGVWLDILNEAGGYAEFPTVFVEYDDNAWKFKFKITWNSPIKYPGTFSIPIPEGTFYNASYQNEETVITFTQDIPLLATEISPYNLSTLDMSTGENLNSVRLTYPIKPSTIAGGPLPYIEKPDGTKVNAISFEPSVMGSRGYMFANFTGTENFSSGKYTFVVPEGACEIIGGYVNSEQTFEYDIKGNITNEEQDYTLTSARLIQNGETYNLLEAGNSFTRIARDADLYFTLASCTADEVWFKIADVTNCAEGDLAAYNNAEAVITNFATLTDGEYYKSIYAINAGYTLYEDHKYCLLIQDNTFQPVSVSATFEGKTSSYKYGNVDVVSITPAPGSLFTINDTMTVTFSAPVKIVTGSGKTGFSLGDKGWADMVTISSNEEMTEYSFTFPESAFLGVSGENCVDVILCATDAEGRYFHPASMGEWAPESTEYWYGNSGQTRLHILYSSYFDTADVSVSPLEAEAIDELTFSAEGLEIAPSWMANIADILDSEDKVVSQVICEGFVINGGNITGVGPANAYTALRIKLSEALTEPGDYILQLPYNMFTVGKENDSKASTAASVKIVISDTVGVRTLDAENDRETVYYNLQGIKVDRPEKGIFLKVENGKAVKVRL